MWVGWVIEERDAGQCAFKDWPCPSPSSRPLSRTPLSFSTVSTVLNSTVQSVRCCVYGTAQCVRYGTADGARWNVPLPLSSGVQNLRP